MGSAFNRTKRQSLQVHIETLIHPATLQAELSVDNMQSTASPHHRNALGKLGRGGVHSSGSSGNTISLHTEQQVPEVKRRSEEKGGKTIRRVKELLRKKQTTRERGHTVFFFPFCGSGMGPRALHGLARAVLLSYTLRPIFSSN